MIRRDWFKRHLEMIAQALGVALGLKEKGEIQAAIASIETSIKEAFGISGKLAIGLPLHEFIKFACRGEEPPPELLAMLEKTFNEWAELLTAVGRVGEATLARTRAQEVVKMRTSSKTGPIDT